MFGVIPSMDPSHFKHGSSRRQACINVGGHVCGHDAVFRADAGVRPYNWRFALLTY